MTFCARCSALGLILLVVLAGSSAAGVIADYGADFLGVSPGTGWDYMWNSGGAIGTEANYTSLVWCADWGIYNYDGLIGWPRAEPAAYVNLSGGGGHPGRGTGDIAGNPVDRFAIVKYTVQEGEGGLIQFNNSWFNQGSIYSNGVEVRLYVNDRLINSFIQPGGVGGSINAALGFLSPGDRVYLAAGPNVRDGADGFGLGYQLATVTDASTLLWNPSHSSPVSGGPGAWHDPNVWLQTDGSTYTTWNNAAGLSAILMAAGGDVTLAGETVARSLNFSSGGYTLSGAGPLKMTGGGSGGAGPATIDVPMNTATIATPVSSDGNLSKVGSGTLVLSGSTVAVPGGLFAVGGNLALAGSSATNVTGYVSVGANWVAGGTSGSLTIQDNASLVVADGQIISIGDNGGYSGTVNQSGTSSVQTTGVRLGHWPSETSYYNLSGGTLKITGTPGADPTVWPEQMGILYVGVDGEGVFRQTGGSAAAHGIVLDGRGVSGSVHTLATEGGTFTIGPSGIRSGTGDTNNAYQLNFGGGTISASADWSSVLNVTLTGAGGAARFDTAGHKITLSGNVTGTGGIIKVGEGTLTLSGSGAFGGNIYAAGGNLVLGGAGTANVGVVYVGVGSGYGIVGGGNGTLTIQDSVSLTTGVLECGNNWPPGSVSAAVVNQTGGDVRTTGQTEGCGVRLGHWPNEVTTYNLSGGALTLNNGYALTMAVDGTGIFNQTGGVLNAQKVIVNLRGGGGGDGTFIVAGGTANIGAGGIVNDSGPATVKYGGLGGTVRATASFSSPLPATLSGTGANAITFDTNGNTITLSGQLSGDGGLKKAGAGTLVLGGASTYTGSTNINAGTLSFSAPAGLGNPGSPTVLGDGANKGTLVYTGVSPASLTQGFTVSAGGGQIDNNGSATLTLSGGSIGGTGPLTVGGSGNTAIGSAVQSGVTSLTKVGAGTVTLSGANAYSGGTTVSTGVLSIASTASLPGWDTAGKYSVAAGAGLAVGNSVTDGNIVTILATNSFAAGAMIGFDTTDADRTYSVSQADPASGAIGPVKVGANMLTLSGTNTYTGGTAINGGVLKFGSLAAIPPSGKITPNFGGAAAVAGAHGTVAEWLADTRLNLAGQGALALAGDSSETIDMAAIGSTLSLGAMRGPLVNYSGSLTPYNSTWRLGGGGGTLLFAPLLDGDKSLVVGNGGGGTVMLTGDHTYTRGTTINAGTLQLGDGLINGSVPGDVLNNGTLAFANAWDQTFAGVIGGGGGVSKSGPGALTLSRANTYTGVTTVAEGILKLGNNSALGSAAGSTIVQSGATLDLTTAAAYEPISIAGDGVGGQGALVNTGDWVTYPNPRTGIIDLTLTGDAAVGGTGRFDIMNSLRGGTYTLTKVGSNYVAVSCPGATLGNIVVKQGQLNIEAANSMGDTSGAYSATIEPGAILSFWSWGASGMTNAKPIVINGGTLYNWEGQNVLTGLVTLNDVPGNQIAVVQGYPDSGPAILTLTGKLTGPGGFAKMDAGTLILTAANDYAGTTTVTAGTLRLTSTAQIASNTIVNAGGLELQGGAKLNSDLTVNAGGVTFDGGGTVTGNATIAGAMNLTSGTTARINGILTITGGTGVSTTLDAGKTLVTSGLVIQRSVVLDGGTLDLSGGKIWLDFSGGGGDIRSGTLRNVGDLLAYGVDPDLPLTIMKTGSGTLVLDGTNTYHGGTEVAEGIVQVANAKALPAGGSLSIAAGATVVLSSGPSAAGGAASGPGAVPVPEPGTLVLLAAAGAVALLAGARRRR